MLARSVTPALALAVSLACHRHAGEPQAKPERAAGSSEQTRPEPGEAMVVAGQVLQGGAPLVGATVGLFADLQLEAVTDDAGMFELLVPEALRDAPMIRVQFRSQDDQRWSVPLRNRGGRITAIFHADASMHVELEGGNAEERAWLEIDEWAQREAEQWYAVPRDDHAALLAHWARIADAIAAETDDTRRGLMLAAQFWIGKAIPEAGVERQAAAEHALAELGLDDPRWALRPSLLIYAAYQTSHVEELRPGLESLISSHPQPEVAAYVAMTEYQYASSHGEHERAAGIWQRWTDRPALSKTFAGPVMSEIGPDRVLAPGGTLPERCIEDLAGGELCTSELRGRVVVLEFWATWCQPCRTAAAELRAAHEQLAGDDAPIFVSINPYEDPDTIAEFLKAEPQPWRHGWVEEAERERFIEQLQISGIPVFVVLDADGTIAASSPQLQPEGIVDRIRGLHGRE